MSPKTLHITNWYASDNQPKRAIWIKDQIDLWRSFSDVDIWHVEFVEDKAFSFELRLEGASNYFIVKGPINAWILIELITFFMLVYLFLFKIEIKKYAAINFHIAYPLLTYWHFIGWIFKKKIFVSEHWSAYHFHFSTENSLTRIKRIFFNNFQWIVVSHALGEDLVSFSGNVNLKYHVVSNVVDIDNLGFDVGLMHYKKRFLMLSQWKEPKDPFAVLKVFQRLGEGFNLRIGGYGPQLQQMRAFVKKNNMSDRVTFLGVLDKSEVKEELNYATAFIHSSKYETFSVVCAEAVVCGCPVIASRVGGIPEFINGNNGILVDNVEEELYQIITGLDLINWDRQRISEKAKIVFNKDLLVRKMIEIFNRAN